MKKVTTILFMLVLISSFFLVKFVKAEVYDVIVDSSVNTLIGTTAIQVKNSTSLCTGIKLWEDTLTCDIVVYLGDPSDASTMYYTIPAGTIGNIDYLIPGQETNGIYIKTTVTAGVGLINYISTKKSGRK